MEYHPSPVAPGVTVERGGRRYVITHLLSLEIAIGRDAETGRPRRLLARELSPAEPVGNHERVGAPSQAPAVVWDADWLEGQRRFAIIRPLLETPAAQRTGEMIARAAAAAGVTSAETRGWVKAYEVSGRISALIPPLSHGGRGGRRLPRETEIILRESAKARLGTQSTELYETYADVVLRCAHANLGAPHPTAVRDYAAFIADRYKFRVRRRIPSSGKRFLNRGSRPPRPESERVTSRPSEKGGEVTTGANRLPQEAG